MEITSDEGTTYTDSGRGESLLLDMDGDANRNHLLPKIQTNDGSESPKDHLQRAFSVGDWAVRDALASANFRRGPLAEEATLITNQAINEVLQSQPDRQAAVQAVLSDFLRKHFIEPRACVVSECPAPRALQEAASQLMARGRWSWEGKKTWHYHVLMDSIEKLTRELNGESTYTLPEGLFPEPTPAPAPAPSLSCRPRPVYRCEVPSCHNSNPFKSAADVERHNFHMHISEEEKPKLSCDYRKCSRYEAPFYRIDHFRDHLRVYHKEDLLRRGCKPDREWWDSRSGRAIFRGWWRCNRCVIRRVDIEAHGFVCPDCGNPCEIERQQYRKSARHRGDWCEVGRGNNE